MFQHANEIDHEEFEESPGWNITRMEMTHACEKEGITREELLLTSQAAAVTNEGV